MGNRMTLRNSTTPALLGAALLALLATGSVAAQTQEPADAPVRKELEALKERFGKTAPPDRVKLYEDGIEQVRKSGVMEKALKVGDKAPDFELPDATGKTVRLADLRARGPVIVTWYRGGWCPYCNVGLRGFQQRLPEIQSAGATLVAISPETPDKSLSTAEKGKLEYPVLSDKGSKVARSFGVAYTLPKDLADSFKGRLDLAKQNGDDGMTLPLGATYVIDREGVVRYAFVDADYRKRAEPAAVVAAVRDLK